MKNRVLLIVLLLSIFTCQLSAGLIDDIEKLEKQKNYNKAINLINSKLTTGEAKDWEDFLYYKLGKLNLKLNKIDNAKELFEKVYVDFPFSDWADNSLYILSKIYYQEKKYNKASSLKKIIRKKYSDSVLTRDKYWLWLKIPSDSRNSEDLSAEESYTSNNIKHNYYNSDHLNFDSTVSEQRKYKLNNINLDFQDADIKKVLTVLSNFLDKKYYIKDYNKNDKITLKSQENLSLEQIYPVLNFILKDLNYNISSTEKGFIVDKSYDVNSYFQDNNSGYVYEIYKIDNLKTKIDKIKILLKDNISEHGTFYFIPNSELILIKEQSKKINDLISSIESRYQEIKNTIVRAYYLKKAKPDLIRDKILLVKSGQKFYINDYENDYYIKYNEKKKLEQVFTNPLYIEAIKKIKKVEIDSKNNSIIITISKDNVPAIDKIISMIDVEINKYKSDIRTYYLKHARAKKVIEHIRTLFLNNQETKKYLHSITADERTNSIIVIGDSELFKNIEETIRKIDIDDVKIKLYYLKYADAESVKNNLETLFLDKKNSNFTNSKFKGIKEIIVNKRTNSLIVIGTSSIFGIVEKLITNLDIDVSKNILKNVMVKNYKLNKANPTVLSGRIRKIVNETVLQKDNKYKNISFEILPSEYDNTVIVISNVKEIFALADKWIKEFDKVQPGFSEFKEFGSFVYYVENNDADDLAKILQPIVVSVRDARKKRREKNNNDLSNVTPELNVIAEKITNSLVITGTEEDYKAIISVIKELDKIPLQVSIEVLIAEVSLTKDDAFGVEWGLMDGKQRFGTSFDMRLSEDVFANIVKSPLKGLRYSVINSNKYDMLLQYLKKNTNVNIVSRPRITAAHNKKAIIKLGKEIPVTKVSKSTDDVNRIENNGYVTEFTEFKDVGIILEVTPKISANGMIGMDLKLEVSDVDPSSQSTLTNPVITKRETSTYRIVKNNNTIIIGGLIKQDDSLTQTKVPVLNKIPVLGKMLFTREEKTKQKTELLIFITPKITAPFETKKENLKNYNLLNNVLSKYSGNIPPVIQK